MPGRRVSRRRWFPPGAPVPPRRRSDEPPRRPAIVERGGLRIQVPQTATRPTLSGENVELNFPEPTSGSSRAPCWATFWGLSYSVDPRIEGTVSIDTRGPIPRQDVLNAGGAGAPDARRRAGAVPRRLSGGAGGSRAGQRAVDRRRRRHGCPDPAAAPHRGRQGGGTSGAADAAGSRGFGRAEAQRPAAGGVGAATGPAGSRRCRRSTWTSSRACPSR